MSRPINTIEVNLDQLASAVLSADAYAGEQSASQIAHILEIGLKNTLGLAGLYSTVHIDLGNGHLLVCTTKVKPKAKAGAEL